jgi:hypothetical protein
MDGGHSKPPDRAKEINPLSQSAETVSWNCEKLPFCVRLTGLSCFENLSVFLHIVNLRLHDFMFKLVGGT